MKRVWRFGLLLLVLLGCTQSIDKAELYQEGIIAYQLQDFESSFRSFYELYQLDPGYQDVQQRLDEIGQELFADLPLHDLEVESDLLQRLLSRGEKDLYVMGLNACLVSVPAGEFLMGSEDGHEDEKPQHLVTLDGFTINRYEITNAQYQDFVLDTNRLPPMYWKGTIYPLGMDAFPVVGIGWPDANAYCAWAGGRLPTEAEWEKACRGEDGLIYPWGDTWDASKVNVDVTVHKMPTHTLADWEWDDWWGVAVASTTGTYAQRIMPVGSFPDGVSPYGTLDMIGNAAEWVADIYTWEDYSALPTVNPIVTQPEYWNHVARGNSWLEPNGNSDWSVFFSRCAARGSSHAGRDDPRMGFRCVFPLP